jgi:hypothetical protein
MMECCLYGDCCNGQCCALGEVCQDNKCAFPGKVR